MRRNITRSGVARKARHQRYQIKNWAGRLPEIPAFIIGNGPSLKEQDLSLIENLFSIGINRCFLPGGIDPTILLWQDISLWNTEYHRLHNTQALKVARDIADPRRIYYNFHLKSGPYKFEKTCHILSGRGSTGPVAMQLAHALGCSPIVLLGCDCKAENGDTNFYGVNRFYTDNSLKNCYSGLQFVKEQCPVQIINCSNNNLWEKQKLSDVVAGLEPNQFKRRETFVKMLLRV